MRQDGTGVTIEDQQAVLHVYALSIGARINDLV